MRGFPLVDEVVGIGGDGGCQPVVDHLVGLRRRRRQRLIGQRAAAGRDAIGVDGVFHHARLGGVIAAIIVGIVADGLQHHPPQHPVARRHLGRLRRHRHQRVHELRIFAAPDPGVHAAHRIADHEPQMLDAEAFRDQPIVRIDHVLVIVFRKRRLHAVGRF